MVELGLNHEVPFTNLAMKTLKKMTCIRLVSDKKIVLTMLKLYWTKCKCGNATIVTPPKEKQSKKYNFSLECRIIQSSVYQWDCAYNETQSEFLDFEVLSELN